MFCAVFPAEFKPVLAAQAMKKWDPQCPEASAPPAKRRRLTCTDPQPSSSSHDLRLYELMRSRVAQLHASADPMMDTAAGLCYALCLCLEAACAFGAVVGAAQVGLRMAVGRVGGQICGWPQGDR